MNAQQVADKWNNQYKFPMKVILHDDDGNKHKTRTRSIAWDLCGSPVVMVEGRAGGYCLDRITPDYEVSNDQ